MSLLVRWCCIALVVMGCCVSACTCASDLPGPEPQNEGGSQSSETIGSDGQEPSDETLPQEVPTDEAPPEPTPDGGPTETSDQRDSADEPPDQPPTRGKAPTKLSWIKRYGKDNRSGGRFVSVSPDHHGAFFALGHPQEPSVVRFDKALKELWRQPLAGVRLTSLITDSQSNAIACGTFTKAISISGQTYQPKGGDALLVKFDFNGKLLWAKTYAVGKSIYEPCSHLVAAPSGGFFLAGTAIASFKIDQASIEPGPEDTRFVAWLDDSGKVQWSSTFRAILTGISPREDMHIHEIKGKLYILVSYKGKLLFGQEKLETTSQAIALLIMDSRGKPSTAFDIAKGGTLHHATTEGTSFFLTGSFAGTMSIGNQQLSSSQGRSGFVTQITLSGAPMWAYTVTSSRSVKTEALLPGTGGSVLLAGRYTKDITISGKSLTTPAITSSRGFLVRIERGGAGTWIKLIDTTLPTDSATPAFALLQTSDGSRHLLGNFTHQLALPPHTLYSAKGAISLATFNASGQFTNAVQTGGGSGSIQIHLVTQTPQGETLVAGHIDGFAQWGGVDLEGGFFLTTISKDGDSGTPTLFKSKAGGTIQGILFGANGQRWLYGSLQGAANFGNVQVPADPKYTFFVARMDASHNVSWVKGYGRASNVHAAVDKQGRLALAGNFHGELNLDGLTLKPRHNGVLGDLFVALVDSEGKGLWAEQFGGGFGARAASLVVDGSDEIYVAGVFQFVLLDKDSQPVTRSAGNKLDGLIMKFNAQGQRRWVRSFDGGDSDTVTGLALDPRGAVWVSGSITGAATFGPLKKTPPTRPAGFLARINASGTFTTLSFHGSHIASLATSGQAVWLAGEFDAQSGIQATAGALSTTEKHSFAAQVSVDGTLAWAVKTGPSRPSSYLDRTGALFLYAPNAALTIDLGQTKGTLAFVNDHFLAKFIAP